MNNKDLKNQGPERPQVRFSDLIQTQEEIGRMLIAIRADFESSAPMGKEDLESGVVAFDADGFLAPFGSRVLGVDTEFIRESSFYPIVEVLQLSTHAHTWVIDLQAFRGEKVKHLETVIALLRDPEVLKVMHAAQGDQECLARAFGITADPVLDTATAASLCGYGESIGLRALLESCLRVSIPKGLTRTDWSKRPLSKQVIEYAHLDVLYLYPLFHSLWLELKKLKREELCLKLSAKFSDPKVFETPPEELAEKVAKNGRWNPQDYTRFLELMRWREKRVRELNLPRRWVADDQVLVDLARTKPRNIEELASFRGLGRGEVKHQGKVLLDIILRDHRDSAIAPPATERRDIPTSEEALMIDYLKMFVSLKSDRLGIGLKQFFSVAVLTKLVKLGPRNLNELKESKLIPAEILELVGAELIEVMVGRMAVKMTPKLELFKIHNES